MAKVAQRSVDRLDVSSGLRNVPSVALALLFLPIALTELGCRAVDCGGSRSRLIYTAANWIALALLFVLLRSRSISLASIGFTRPPPGWWKLSIAGLVVGAFVVYPIAQLVNAVLGTQMREHLMTPKASVFTLAVQLVYAVVTAPIAEETLFRGFALTTLRAKGLGTFAASLITVVAFASIHIPGYGLGGAIFVFMWAWILTFLYVRTGSLWPGIAMHAMTNAGSYIFLPLVARLH